MRRTAAIALALLLLAAAGAPGAIAQTSPVPDQYIEGVPGARGEKKTRDLTLKDSELPPGAAETLAGKGSDGLATALVAKATDPAGEARAPAAEGSDASEGGMGVVLPIILALTLAAALAAAFMRWRRGTPTGTA